MRCAQGEATSKMGPQALPVTPSAHLKIPCKYQKQAPIAPLIQQAIEGRVSEMKTHTTSVRQGQTQPWPDLHQSPTVPIAPGSNPEWLPAALAKTAGSLNLTAPLDALRQGWNKSMGSKPMKVHPLTQSQTPKLAGRLLKTPNLSRPLPLRQKGRL